MNYFNKQNKSFKNANAYSLIFYFDAHKKNHCNKFGVL